jgi:Fe2+ or Zn2+ uptake regulation protein
MMKQEEIHKRHDRIVQKLSLNEESGHGLEEATALLAGYLRERNGTLTSERKFILWTVYHVDTPFDVDALHELVCRHRGYVCRVTVYNTLLLFTEAGVVSRFQPFANGAQYFEKCVGQQPHGYQVCRRCGAIKVLDISQVTDSVVPQMHKTFRLSQFCFYAIGLCKNCYLSERHEVLLRQRALAAEKKKAEQKKQAAKKRKPVSVKPKPTRPKTAD